MGSGSAWNAQYTFLRSRSRFSLIWKSPDIGRKTRAKSKFTVKPEYRLKVDLSCNTELNIPVGHT